MDKRKQCTRRVQEGVVVSDKMDKTVTVKVTRRVRHPHFGKIINLSKRYYAHTEEKVAAGTKVRIAETRPLSKLKRWRVTDILETKATEK